MMNKLHKSNGQLHLFCILAFLFIDGIYLKDVIIFLKSSCCFSTDIYPRPKPHPQPQPGNPGNSGGYFNDVDRDDGRYPPRPRPPAGGGGGGYSSYDNSGNTHGRRGYRPNSRYGNTYGGDHHSTYGNPEGNMVAKIVSPIVSVVVVTLLGAAASYFKLNNGRNCFRTREPENV
ncbi:glycoprotein Xg [Macaca thibetana thibetana]|nr:glycoprotein Xg [Macaca thibetana thibetana]